MKTKFKIFLVLIIGFTLTLPMGCGQKKSSSGFLQDYSYLKPGPTDGADLVYIKEGVNFSVYNKVMIDQVIFYYSEDATYRGIDPNELKELADAFHKAFVDELADGFTIVAEPGPGVMRIRTAITGLVPSKPGLNAITTIVPVGLAISSLKRVATGTHTFVGQASAEMEILDSQTNGLLAAAVDTKAGAKYQVIEGMEKWGHAKDAFTFWAKRLRSRLDDLQGRK
jgi:hypothetical protein